MKTRNENDKIVFDDVLVLFALNLLFVRYSACASFPCFNSGTCINMERAIDTNVLLIILEIDSCGNRSLVFFRVYLFEKGINRGKSWKLYQEKITVAKIFVGKFCEIMFDLHQRKLWSEN